MQATANSRTLHLIEHLADGSLRRTPLTGAHAQAAQPGVHYAVIDLATGAAPKGLVLKRQGGSLLVELQEPATQLELSHFDQAPDAAFLPEGRVDGDTLAGTLVVAAAPGPDSAAGGNTLAWTAAGDDAAVTPLQMALGGIGLGLSALGISAGGGSSAATAAVPRSQVTGTVVGGPVVAGNGLTVTVYQADGVTRLGEAKVERDGSFSVMIGGYTGVVVAKVSDTDSGPDYLDETTGAGKDLNAALSSTDVVLTPNATLVMNINVLTTLAHQAAANAAGAAPLTATAVNDANHAIAQLFGLDSLQTTAVTPVNGGSYEPGNGLNQGEVYGAVLAALSGADAAHGGDSQQTVDTLLAGISLSGNQATLSEAAQTLVVVGAERAAVDTGPALSGGVATLVDTYAPVFGSGSDAGALDEGRGALRVVYTAVATDAGRVSWSLKSVDDHALFAIDASTGVVALLGNPDHETRPGYSFTVVATDTAGNSSEQVVGLRVNDLDEVAPVVTSGAVAATINENSGAGQLVYTATSTDTGDVSGGVSYSLKTTGDHALFTINASTGAVTLTGSPDHESKPNYSFTVLATDAAGNSSERAVSLGVNNLDESAPSITSGATAATINENSGTGQVVYIATSTDSADIASGSTSYSLKAAGDHAAFTINASTGAVTLTGNPDHESKASYSFTVIATDAAGNSSERAVGLGINDLDESAPTLTSGATATTINENSGAGQAVYTATSTDTGDVSGGVSYRLKATGDHALFSIDAATGAVTLTGNPDHESKPSYAFTVVATDAAGNGSEQAVSLGINDLDESAPTLTSGTTATTVNENSGAGQVVYTATSTDTGDVSGGVSYSLKAAGDHTLFTIHADTGAVTLTGNPDHENKPGYSFTVVATDAAGNSSERAVSLGVTDLDESAPSITSGATATTINENSGAGQWVYSATSTDAGDVSGGVSYSLKTTGDHTLFTINASTGAVTLTANPDHETKPNYAFTVVATDAAGNSSEQAVSLAVTDLDESAPTLTSGATATTIDENSGAGQIVYTATSTDTGDVSGGISYSLKSAGDHALFTINAATGAVTLTGNPDHESKPSYTFTVVATDAAGNSSEQAVSLALTDLDESAPSITSGASASTINENSGGGQVVYTATSTDAGDVSGGVSYSLKAVGDHALFTVNAATGAVTLTGNPDHETKPSYAFTVVATDAAGNSSEQAVSLALNDLDESAPTVTSGATATAINENSGAGQVVYTVTSSDAGDVSGGINYSLKAVGDHALFTIHAATGAVTLTANPDHETRPSYSFTVVATDAAGNSSERAVSLALNDLDESAPTFTSGATATTIAENSGAGQVVYTATSTDSGDIASGSTSYGLKATGDHTLFTINAGTGAVTLTGNPDHESKPSYSFTVIATDAAGNSSEQAVSLGVTDLDESAPSITSGATATTINENSGAGQVVYTATSTDAGDVSGGVSYSLKTTGDHTLVTINASTGAVTLTGNPDHETKPSYAFTVVATDAAGNSSEQAVSLALTDLDESAPSITSSGTAVAITENSGAGQVVYTATSTDSGDIASGSTSYSLKATGDHAAFSIDASTGAVTLTGNPDHETKPSYGFTVVATDTAGNSSEQAVTLAINDIADETAPSVASIAISSATGVLNGSVNAGDVVHVTVTMDEATVVDTSGGAPRVALTIGASTVYASYASGSGSTALVFDYTVQGGDTDGNGIAIGANALQLNGGTLCDAAGNAATLTHGSVADNTSYLVDTSAPSFSSGTTAAAINENSGASQVVYTAAASDSAALTYSLKATGDHTAFSIDGSTGAVTLTGNPDYETKSSYAFTVVATDAAGNASERAVSLAINNLDDVAPNVSSVAVSGATGAMNSRLNAGDVVNVTVTMDEATVVNTTGGTPRLALNVGGSTVYANYASGSNSTALVFNYTVQSGDTDANGISIGTNALQLNGGTLQDTAGNNATLTHALVSDNASYLVDTTAPTLSSSTPADNGSSVAVGNNIVLNFSETVLAGTGNIVISNGAGDTRTISVADSSQVTVSGSTVTVNPTADLNAGTGYNVQLASGVLTDQAGNAYGGISNSTTLNFTTASSLNTAVVVFDLVEGTSSDHSSRTFASGTAYTIYIRVDSTTSALSTDGTGPGASDTWGAWSGANNLGGDDRIVLVGSGSAVKSYGNHTITRNQAYSSGMTWSGATNPGAFLSDHGRFGRLAQGVQVTRDLWAGSWSTSPNAGSAFANVYKTTMPAGILTSQGLK